MRPMVTLFLVSGLALASNAMALDQQGTEETIVTFACTTPDVFESAKLASAIEKSGHRLGAGPGVWGDRAVAVALDVDSAPEFLVPLDCGATGNCNWVVLDDDATILDGIIEGCVLFVRRTQSERYDIHAVVRFSVSEGRYLKYVPIEGGYWRQSSGKLKPEAVVKFTKCLDDTDCCIGGQQSN